MRCCCDALAEALLLGSCLHSFRQLSGDYLRRLLSWQAGMWGICVWGLKGEQLGAEQRARGGGRLAAETPVLSERLLCRAEQVSVEQLSPSLEANTLWIIVIYPPGATSLLRSLPSCPSLSLSAPTLRASFLPGLLHLPLISCSVYCGGPLTKQLNESVKYTDSLVVCLRLSLAAHFQICQHGVNALNLRLPPSAPANYWSHERKEVALSGARPDGSFRMKERLFSRLPQLSSHGNGSGLVDLGPD